MRATAIPYDKHRKPFVIPANKAVDVFLGGEYRCTIFGTHEDRFIYQYGHDEFGPTYSLELIDEPDAS